MSRATEAVERYLLERPRFELLAEDVAVRVQRILMACEVRGEVHARAKDVASFRGKITRKHYLDPWNQITDKAGVRIIVQLPSEVTAVIGAIGESSELDAGEPLRITPDGRLGAEGAGGEEGSTRLGYTGTHIQVRVPEGEHAGYECEVQVRTRAQDLWSVLSHEFLYKPVVDLPPEHRRALYRLSALTEIVDAEVERAQEFLSHDEVNALSRVLEFQWAGLGLPTGDGQLTQFIVSALVRSAGDAERLTAAIRTHVSQHAEDIRLMQTRYGTNKDGYLVDNTLFDQPELILIRVLLEEGRLSAGQTWVEAGLPPEWLNAVALRLGDGNPAIL